ncbi:MAG: hypothetical protein KDA99_30770, partial [Planctomycetales bacterium]|nr:hypothetical protein [Planctomycetales bacterium]
MKHHVKIWAAVALVTSALLASSASGQTTANFVPATGDWNTGANWSTGFVPSTFLDEVAAVGNGKTATVSNAPLDAPGAVTINNGGAVDITSSGNLTVDPTGGAAAQSGAMTINAGGMLSIASGGQLNAAAMTNNGTLTLNGPNADVNITGNLTLGAAGTLNANITSNSFTAMSAGGRATLGGQLNVNFTGAAPAPGSSWTLADAATMSGNFSSINITGSSGLQPWQTYVVETVAGGAGSQAKLAFVERLLLTVNRDTGATSISNPGGSAIPADGYIIHSNAGSLRPSSLNSLDEQGVDGDAWKEIGNQTANNIAELRPVGQSSIATGTNVALGNIFLPAIAPLGQEVDDLTFTYTDTSGAKVRGQVQYVGQKSWNNVVVVIDPATGQAVLQNQAPFGVTIEGYAVTSAAGSITPGTWTSLEEQGSSGWVEILSNSNQLGELQGVGTTTLASKQVYDLGKIFNVGGSQDLKLQILLEGESLGFNGVVVYGDLPSGNLPGDYNGNGSVDAADYTVWK